MTDPDLLATFMSRWQENSERGGSLTAVELCQDHPDLLPEVQRRIKALDQMERLLQELAQPTRDYPQVTPSPQSTADWGPVLPRIPGYEILGELGRGGMGLVCQARDLKLKRLVALKMILAGGQASPQQRARFLAEAEAVARLHHPHIVQVFAFGEQEGNPYFVMEFVPGGSLDRKLHKQPQPARDAARLVVLLARAVQFAHEQGIVHRDLKPANVLMAPPSAEPALNSAWGCPKITDFGLARKLDGDTGLSLSGQVLGTPAYMSPEQAAGNPGEIGPTTDVYALGAILYQLLTGKPPFQGTSTGDILVKVMSRDPDAPGQVHSNVPPELEAICLHCLRKRPEQRYASAGELAAQLQRYLDRPAEPIAPVPLSRATAPRLPFHWALAVAPTLVGLLLVAVGLFLWQPWRPASNDGESGDGDKVSRVAKNANKNGSPPPAKVAKTSNKASDGSAGQELVGANKKTGSQPAVAKAPLLVEAFRVKVWADGKEGIDIRTSGALPVRNGNKLQVEVKLNQPGFVYLLWLDSEGKVWPLYPWNPGNELEVDLKAPVPKLNPQEEVQSPAGSDVGWVMGGPSGLEAILVLVRRTPLPVDAPLEATLGRLLGRPYDNPQELVVQGLDRTKPVLQFNQKRRPQLKAQAIDSQMLQLCRRLQQTYELDAVRLIGFAHQE
jgi:serine/threonine protein kinase